MKKLFTLVALLAMVLGANAQKWEKVYSIDYTTLQNFPFYVMGYVPEFSNGCMTDFGSAYRYATQEALDGTGDDKWKDGESSTGSVMAGKTEYQKVTGAGPYWHQYFIADNITTKIDGKYKVIAKVKATNACTVKINMGWGWGDGQQASANVDIPGDADFQTVEWQYEGIGGSSCNLVAQPGTCAETIEWESLEVYEWQKETQRPKVWLEDIENGDASKTWEELGLADVKFNDQENNFKVCAWSKERMVNTNADGGWDPFPAGIEADPADPSNKVFVCHGQAAITEGDAAAWDNQFWIQSKHAWKSGTTLKIKFRYKASKEVTCQTQIHKQNPSDYLHYQAIGDMSFTESWQTFEKDVTIADAMNGGWSVAFNLNSSDKDAIDFYFDDLSWQYLKLDEGYFVSGVNVTVNPDYDNLDNAIQFEAEVDDKGKATGNLVATVGEKGNAATYVDQIMISTTRGDDQAFKGATLKPAGKIKNDADAWQEYVASSNAKLDLPGLGVWKVYLDLEYTSIAFEMLEGKEYKEEPVDIVTNAEVITINGVEREDLKDSWDANKQELTVREEADNNTAEDSHGVGGEGHNGEAWDNQFFIVANRTLAKGEKTILAFKYKADKEAKTTTQCHVAPGEYKHYAAIGDVTFTEEWQEFKQEFDVPTEADGMKSIAFNMAEIKDACVYELKDFQWYLVDEEQNAQNKTYENLIWGEGGANFFIKVGAGSNPVAAGITEVVNKNKKSSNVMYNLAGQRVSNGFKGIVIKDGKKMVNK
ncbi:MAG: hypothetical protein K6F43_07535 [Prevotella sp.]|nr:hypothetical protein [Prevotella sp.]